MVSQTRASSPCTWPRLVAPYWGILFLIQGCAARSNSNVQTFETDHFVVVTPAFGPSHNIVDGDLVDCEFSLASRISEKAQIDEIKAGCGCMKIVARQPSGPTDNALETRQTKAWQVTVNTHSRVGATEFPIEIHYHVGKANHVIKIPILIAVHRGVYCDPQVVVINDLEKQDSFAKKVVLYRDVPETLISVESVKCTDPTIHVELQNLEPGDKGNTSQAIFSKGEAFRELLISGQVDQFNRERQEDIVVSLKGKSKKMRIPILLRPKTGEVRFSPDSLTFDTISHVDRSSRVVLQSRSPDYLVDLSIDGLPNWLAADVRLVGRHVAVVNLKTHDVIVAGEHTMTIRKQQAAIATISIVAR